MDIYSSNEELLIIIPLWGVEKSSINLSLETTNLIIKWNRSIPTVKDNLLPIQQDCFRWNFEKTIELPQNVYFDKIHSKLTNENILIIVVPKVVIPEKIRLEIEWI
jgi:HSP20 family molecular chaperone IbpA